MTEILINGPQGKLHGFYKHSENSENMGLVFHPRNCIENSVDNNVVNSLFESFSNNNFSTLKINFRGINKSEGEIEEDGFGELSDAASVLDWLQQYNTNSKICWVAGFSFGAWVAMQLLMRRPEINGFISVSPPANLRDFSFLAPCPSSGLIVHGDRDNIASFDSTKILAEKLQKQKKVDIKFKAIKGADHFYENYSEEFTLVVDKYIKDNLRSN